MTIKRISDSIRHFFHVVSNVRPIYWICLYIFLTPLFALVYWALPDSQFRIPDGGDPSYGSWLYYSIVTITTLGFGDYTPAHGWAQLVTAIEVMFGLTVMGFFLNSVGSMKSEIDIETEMEKQRLLHERQQKDRLLKGIPSILHNLNIFLSYCYAVTTPVSERGKYGKESYNPDFQFSDMRDLYKPSGLPIDRTPRSAIEGLLKSASRTSLILDSLQNRTDLSLWPELLESCFAFVANYQMFTSDDAVLNLPAIRSTTTCNSSNDEKANEKYISDLIASGVSKNGSHELAPLTELYTFIKENGSLARKIEVTLTRISSAG